MLSFNTTVFSPIRRSKYEYLLKYMHDVENHTNEIYGDPPEPTKLNQQIFYVKVIVLAVKRISV